VHRRHRAQLHHNRSRNSWEFSQGPKLVPRMTAIGHTVMPRGVRAAPVEGRDHSYENGIAEADEQVNSLRFL
jgi:hypothetical protein